MILIYENKGILIPVYWVTSVFVTAIGGRALYKFFIGPEIPDTFVWIGMGCSFLMTSLWIYLTKNDYYRDRTGKKTPLEIRHSFFLIKLDYWVYIFLVLGLTLMLVSLF